MQLICTECATIGSLVAVKNEEDRRAFEKVFSELKPPLHDYCLHYLALFRPRPKKNVSRGLLWPKALRLLKEVKALTDTGYVKWGSGPDRSIDAYMWSVAMERMVERPPRDLPLEKHNYLRKVAYGLADGADRDREMARNQGERDGSLLAKLAKKRESSTWEPSASDFSPAMSPEQMQAIKKKNMGRKK